MLLFIHWRCVSSMGALLIIFRIWPYGSKYLEVLTAHSHVGWGGRPWIGGGLWRKKHRFLLPQTTPNSKDSLLQRTPIWDSRFFSCMGLVTVELTLLWLLVRLSIPMLSDGVVFELVVVYGVRNTGVSSSINHPQFKDNLLLRNPWEAGVTAGSCHGLDDSESWQ